MRNVIYVYNVIRSLALARGRAPWETKHCVGGLLGKHEEAALFSVLDALRAFCACNRIDRHTCSRKDARCMRSGVHVNNNRHAMAVSIGTWY